MKTPLINIPKFFHELFGSQQRKSELIIVIGFSAAHSWHLDSWHSYPLENLYQPWSASSMHST